MSISIREIPPEQTHVMRQRILRSHQTLAEMDYPGDRDADSRHFGAFSGRKLVGIASVYQQPWPRDPQPADWRLRGMAVDESKRGEGIGAALLLACARHIAGRHGRRLWCNARTPAIGFYERCGLAVGSEVWDGGGTGPHVDMAGPIAEMRRRLEEGLRRGASAITAVSRRQPT